MNQQLCTGPGGSGRGPGAGPPRSQGVWLGASAGGDQARASCVSQSPPAAGQAEAGDAQSCARVSPAGLPTWDRKPAGSAGRPWGGVSLSPAPFPLPLGSRAAPRALSSVPDHWGQVPFSKEGPLTPTPLHGPALGEVPWGWWGVRIFGPTERLRLCRWEGRPRARVPRRCPQGQGCSTASGTASRVPGWRSPGGLSEPRDEHWPRQRSPHPGGVWPPAAAGWSRARQQGHICPARCAG